MIFVTVGGQTPFDRLVQAVDDWAARRDRRDLFAQVGNGTYLPRNFEWTRFLSPLQFRSRVQEADLLVAHAGMGSILTALEHGKPILILPRRGDLSETRNDHQIASARHFRNHDGVRVAFDLDELAERLDEAGRVGPVAGIRRDATPELIDSLRRFIVEV